ncbi:helix-turn-helix domain-containing protein [archaeon]|jgi:uncharacterized protein|nr:helix-turn-helix domain-containing protein [archaeon]MBT4417255.1 helix-turn-helix domain-containing protein [archaeon]
MNLPQEIEVWYIIPAIRKELAKALLEEDLTQKEIAKRLCITEAAVSQYLKNKRGKDVKFSPAVLNQIKISARRIVDSKAKSASMKELQRICKYLKRRDHMCKIHRSLNQGLKGCRACKR